MTDIEKYTKVFVDTFFEVMMDTDAIIDFSF